MRQTESTYSASNTTADFLTSVPTHVLEKFIPGFGILSGFLEVSLGVDVSTLVSTSFTIIAVAGALSYVGRTIWRLIGQRLMCSISVYSNDKLHEQVMHWISQQKVSKSSRSLRATTNQKQGELRGLDANVRRHNQGPTNFYFASIESSIPPEYTPAHGHHWFWYKGRIIFFHREMDKQALDLFAGRNPQQEREVVHLKCFGRSPTLIKQLLMEVKTLDAQQNKSTTTIRRSPQGPHAQWSLASKRPSRSLETVFMDETVKNQLLEDIREFLDPNSPIFYARRGIPYRRGYLFYGPPGTGKTSLSFSLAGEFGFELYTTSLREPFMSEHKLTQLFASLPNRCIVLLEDVDTAGLEKRSTPEDGKTDKRPRIRNETVPIGTQTITSQGADGITLSGLLNAIDGVASQEGRILIMTSNDPESLDKALIRPGRVDRQVYFSNASRQHIKQIFLSMYAKDDPKDSPQTEVLDDGAKPERSSHNSSRDDNILKDMAENFATILPDLIFTPAEVQGFLLVRRKNPQKAIEDAPSWRDSLLAAKEAGKNVIDASANNEEKDAKTETGQTESADGSLVEL